MLRIEIDFFLVDFSFSIAYWMNVISVAEEQKQFEEWVHNMLTRVEFMDEQEKKPKPKPKPKPKTPAKPKPKPKPAKKK